MNTLKKVLFSLCSTCFFYPDHVEAFYFTVDDVSDTAEPTPKINDTHGSTLRKVCAAIKYLYGNKSHILVSDLKSLFPGIQVTGYPQLESPQEVAFSSNIDTINLLSEIHFATEVNIVFDGGTDNVDEARVTLSGMGSHRLFNIHSSQVTLAFRGFKFINGFEGIGAGGAFLLQSGNLSIYGSKFENNRSSDGGAIRNDLGTLNIYHSAFYFNRPPKATAQKATDLNDIRGGAISSGGGVTTIYGESGIGVAPFEIDNETAVGNKGPKTELFTVFNGNAANEGGAISCNGSGATTINNGHFQSNAAANLNKNTQFSNYKTGGGAVSATFGCKLEVSHSLFFYNTAIGSGSAISVAGGSTNAEIKQSAFHAGYTYRNAWVTQAGKVHGGAVSSDGASLIFYRNSLFANESENGTLLLMGPEASGVVIANNAIMGASGSVAVVNNVTDFDNFPYNLAVTDLTDASGYSSIVVINLTSSSQNTNKNKIIQNVITAQSPAVTQILFQKTNLLFANNIIFSNDGSHSIAPCKQIGNSPPSDLIAPGHSKGNVEFYNYGKNKKVTCGDINGAGSIIQDPMLDTKITGYNQAFLKSFPDFYKSYPHPGDSSISNNELGNLYDQKGFLRAMSKDPYLPGALVPESANSNSASPSPCLPSSKDPYSSCQ